MKTLLLILFATSALVFASGCASKTTIGTKHHHVSVGGDVR
ncbi:MAG: hypothetical protein ABJF10_29415 [Chthoniobacter sp.]